MQRALRELSDERIREMDVPPGENLDDYVCDLQSMPQELLCDGWFRSNVVERCC